MGPIDASFLFLMGPPVKPPSTDGGWAIDPALFLLLSEQPPVPIDLPLTLFAAIKAAADADPALGSLEWGGLWKDKAPPGLAADIDFGTFAQTSSTALLSTSDSEIKDVRVRFRVHSADPDRAEATLETLASSVRFWPALAWVGGDATPAFETDRSSAPTRSRRSGDMAAWQTDVTMMFRVRRYLR